MHGAALTVSLVREGPRLLYIQEMIHTLDQEQEGLRLGLKYLTT